MVQLCPTTSKNKLSFLAESQIPAQFDGEPIENLSKRHKTDPKTKSTKTAKARDEVQPSHLWQPLEFCDTHIAQMFCFDCLGCNSPYTVGSPKKMFTIAMSLS